MLLAAIAAHRDDHSRLVYADWLQSRGDRRGELIVLEHRERTTPGGLTHPDQLASLLRLAAELGFPHLPDPDAHILPFEPAHGDRTFRVDVGGHRYVLDGRDGLSLTCDETPVANLTLRLERPWNDQETNVILSIVSRAIRAGTPFDRIQFPNGAEMQAHPDHRLGPFPTYFSAEIYEDFDQSWRLRARDHARWYALYDRMMAGYSPTSHRPA